MKNMYRLIKEYVKGGIPFILLLAGLKILSSIICTASVSLFSEIMNMIGSPETERIMTMILEYVAFVLVGSIALDKGAFYIAASAKEKSTSSIRCALHAKVQKLPVRELNELSIPDVVTSGHSVPPTVNTIFWIPQLVSRILVSAITSVLVFLRTDVILTAIVFSIAVPFTVIILCERKKIVALSVSKRKSSGEISEAYSRANCFSVIKAFAQEQSEISNFISLQKKFENASLKKRKVGTNLSLVTTIMFSLIEITIIVYCVITQKTVGQVVLFNSLIGNIITPITDLPDILDDISTASANVDKIMSILDKEEEEDGEISIDSFEGVIEFKSVSFAYENAKNTLKNIALKINKGDKIGIYGPSGSGKSTFVNLIPRYFDVSDGAIYIDGIDIRNLRKDALRRRIGIVSQNVQLFSNTTIRENIMYGNMHATEQEMIEVAKKANAYDFIMSFPNGFDSVVGNNGVKLSGGEQQRISIARIFLANPDIIILDEATSKLDNASEKEVQKAIDNLGKDKTVITIAHRLTTIMNCDKLIGIQNHEICESGSVAELKADEKSLFYKLLHQ